MEIVRLFKGEALVREFSVGARPVALGSDPSADVVLGGPGVWPHELVLLERGGELVCFPLGPRASRRAEPFGAAPRCLGDFRLERAKARDASPWQTREWGDATTDAAAEGTDLVPAPDVRLRDLAVLVGEYAEARRYRLGVVPVSVGTAPENDVVVRDRTVSRFHLRFEPMGRGVLVRDLGSRNGTWCGGTRVGKVEVELGATLRVGRTLLRVVPAGASEEAAGLAPRGDAEPFWVASPVMAAAVAEAERAAKLDWTVLVTGPSGAGKEGIARRIHDASPRAGGPFVAINAGAIPEPLVESELFGHARGAFTGATEPRRGVFAQAHGGTLFIDEIAELPVAMQSRLLRVLETWRVRPVGAEQESRVDVRVVVATHRDLRERVRSGAFREDLYFRVARAVIAVPPLAERPEDVELLAVRFLERAHGEVGPRCLSRAALDALRAYRWPGNVRELRNVISAMALHAEGAFLDESDVERAIVRVGAGGVSGETPRVDAALARFGGNLSAAARALGIPRSTLRDRVRAERGSLGA